MVIEFFCSFFHAKGGRIDDLFFLFKLFGTAESFRPHNSFRLGSAESVLINNRRIKLITDVSGIS